MYYAPPLVLMKVHKDEVDQVHYSKNNPKLNKTKQNEVSRVSETPAPLSLLYP